jgi:hypothetical protein
MCPDYAEIVDDDERVRISAAERLITERYSGKDAEMRWDSRRQWDSDTAVAVLATAIEDSEYSPDIVPEDAVRAGLTLIRSARNEMRASELDVIRHARLLGIAWEEIGAALGMTEPGAAEAHYERLEETFNAELER